MSLMLSESVKNKCLAKRGECRQYANSQLV